MTVLEVLTAANKSAGITTELKFAKIEEFQAFMDSFQFNQWPINILVPYNDVGTWSNGIRSSEIQITGWVLTRVEEEPNDFRSRPMEEKYLASMRLLAKKFIGAVLDSDIRDQTVNDISDTIRPEYLFLNAQTFGVSYEFRLPIREIIC